MLPTILINFGITLFIIVFYDMWSNRLRRTPVEEPLTITTKVNWKAALPASVPPTDELDPLVDALIKKVADDPDKWMGKSDSLSYGTTYILSGGDSVWLFDQVSNSQNKVVISGQQNCDAVKELCNTMTLRRLPPYIDTRKNLMGILQ